MTLLKILILAVVQGATELLPVSSSAHVIIAEKLLGLDPVSPEMTLLLVMLHTGTMFAVLIYFWHEWKVHYFHSRDAFWNFAKIVTAGTVLTGAVGLSLKFIIEKVFLANVPHAEIELIFGNMDLIALSLFCVGLLIIYSGRKADHFTSTTEVSLGKSCWIGAVQGVCLPFRGFSRSGATISTGLALGINRMRVEEYSFALVLVLTPPVIFREVYRLLKAHDGMLTSQTTSVGALFYPSLVGMVFSFLAGLLALKFLSSWLERGRWQLFGYYCLGAAMVVFLLHRSGY